MVPSEMVGILFSIPVEKINPGAAILYGFGTIDEREQEPAKGQTLMRLSQLETTSSEHEKSLDGFGVHSDAVLINQFATQPSRNSQQRDCDDRKPDELARFGRFSAQA